MERQKRRYSSVAEMVRDTPEPEIGFADAFDEHVAERKIIKHLISLRASRGISQKDIAARLGCSQSRVSKLESGADSDLRLGDLDKYAHALGVDVQLLLLPHQSSAVDRIKFHAFMIRLLLKELASLANKDEAIARAVAQFHGEAFLNMIKILQDSAAQLPRNSDDAPYIRIIGPEILETTSNGQQRDESPCETACL